jgi:nitric oxide reductase NorE protein
MTELLKNRWLVRTRSGNGLDNRHLPGEKGIWILVLGEMSIFGILFCAYLFARSKEPLVFDASKHSLNTNYAFINTLLLLGSSLLVVNAIRALRLGRQVIASRLFAGGLLCGLAFSSLKILEYHDKVDHNLVVTTNDFYMWFFALTGYHFYHLIVGMGLLACLVYMTRVSNECSPQQLRFAESCAVFWHMVDLLWIVLFPLLYLVK